MNELQSVTDIDEVIKYAERRAEGCHQMASSYHTDEGVYLQEETRFQYRAILWENIHEWLEELKELRKKKRPHGEWKNGVCTICGAECFEDDYMRDIETEFCHRCGAPMTEEAFRKYNGLKEGGEK